MMCGKWRQASMSVRSRALHGATRIGGPVARSAVFPHAWCLRYFLDVSPPSTPPDGPDVPPPAPPSALVRALTRPVTGASRLVVPDPLEPPEACSAPVDDDATDVACTSGLLALPVALFGATLAELGTPVSGANGLPGPPTMLVSEEVSEVSVPVRGASGLVEPPILPSPAVSVPGSEVRMLVSGANGLPDELPPGLRMPVRPPSGLPLPEPPVVSRPSTEVTVLPNWVTTLPRFLPIGLPVALPIWLPAVSRPWPMVDSSPLSGLPKPVVSPTVWVVCASVAVIGVIAVLRVCVSCCTGPLVSVEPNCVPRLLTAVPTVEIVLPSGFVSGLSGAVGPLPRLVTSCPALLTA